MAKKDNNQLFMSLFYDEDEINLKGPTVEEEEYEFSTGLSTKYTTKVNTIHYTPNGPCPAVSDLYNYKKYLDLLDKINSSSVSEDEKLRQDSDDILQIRVAELKYLEASSYATVSNEIYNGYKTLLQYLKEISNVQTGYGY